MGKVFSIAELSREFGITTRTVRFYEDKRLLFPKRDGNRRVFNTRDRVRLRLILRGKRLGFSLLEIREIIDLYDKDPTEVKQLQQLIRVIRSHKNSLLLKLKDIKVTLKELQNREQEYCKLLSKKAHSLN